MANNKIWISLSSFVLLLGSIIAMGGIGKINKSCNENSNDENTSDAHSNGDYLSNVSMTTKGCADSLSYYWWGIAFGIVFSLVVLTLALLGKTRDWSSTLQALSAACVSVAMRNANSGYLYYMGFNAGNAAVAGYIIQCVALYSMIILLGIDSVTTIPVRPDVTQFVQTI